MHEGNIAASTAVRYIRQPWVSTDHQGTRSDKLQEYRVFSEDIAFLPKQLNKLRGKEIDLATDMLAACLSQRLCIIQLI